MNGTKMYSVSSSSNIKLQEFGGSDSRGSFKPSSDVVLSLDRPMLLAPSLPKHVSDDYVKTISGDLRFEESVVRDRCFHTLPYDKKYLRETLDGSDIVPQPPKTKYTLARYNKRGPDKRHALCLFKKKTTHKLKPLPRKILDKGEEMHKQEMEIRALKQQEAGLEGDTKSTVYQTTEGFHTNFFMTDLATTIPPSSAVTARYSQELSSHHNWDEYLLAMLSEDTSHWIASHQSDPHFNQDRLKNFLKERHGFLDNRAELVKDNVSEADFFMGSREATNLSMKKWRRPDETLLDRVREQTVAQGQPTDPYDDDTNAAFYRLPAGFKMAKKAQDKEEDATVQAACNTTAFNLDIPHYLPPPPQTIRDFLHPRLNKTVYDTNNAYQQEWLTGGKQVYNKYESQDHVFINNNKYKKVFQKDTPRRPNTWYPLTPREMKDIEKTKKTIKVVEKGLHRWKDLPEPLDERPTEDTDVGADSGFSKTHDPKNEQFHRTKNTLTRVINDWRSKWHLDMRYADATPEDMIRDMADIHPHIRLKAITTCARAAEYKPPPEQGINLEKKSKVDHIKLLPENLFVALECCLDDKHERVALAAAIALYTLERPCEKAEVLLRKALNQQGGSADRWASAQCLAYYGECDSEVVGELIYQLLEGEDPVRHQQAGELLSLLSENSTLVHSMLAEQLNSSSWRHRVMACMVIPKLQGSINKDLVHKLTHMMWTDWHSEVRRECAQTLGRTGHGKDVHDQLVLKLSSSVGEERNRVEAVAKVGYLGIMTPKLLPPFLECFDDEYVSVRIEVCIACGNLKIKEPRVIQKLIFAATYDPIWKVKALALQALGTIKYINKEVRDTILWAFKFEGVPGVRAEACQSIMRLQMNDPEVVAILQDKYLVEQDEIVREKLEEVLQEFGISPSEDMEMVAKIKGEVRKLCTKNKIALQVMMNEKEDEQRENRQRMIYRSPEQKKQDKTEPRYRPFSQASQGSRPGTTIQQTPALPDIGTSQRPISPESSIVDREIREVFMMAKKGRLTPELLSEYTQSRPTTAVSKKSDEEGGITEEEEAAGQPEGQALPASQEELKQKEKSLMESTPVNPPEKNESGLSDKQLYIGIGEGSDNAKNSEVISINHEATDKDSTNANNSAQKIEQVNNNNQASSTTADQQIASVADANSSLMSREEEDTTTYNDVKTPKTLGTTEGMFVNDGDEDDVHNLSDSFTLPGSTQDAQSEKYDITMTSHKDDVSSITSGLEQTQMAASTPTATSAAGTGTGAGAGGGAFTVSGHSGATSVRSMAREPSELGSIMEEPEHL